jgi:hypothetical protein
MPAGIINTGNHPKLLWPGIRAVWGQVYNEHPVEYTDLYAVDTDDKAYVEDVKVTGFGLATIKPEGQAGTFDSELQGGITRFTHVAYSLGYIVTHEELSDNQYEEVSMRRAKANAFSMAQTVEVLGAFLYNNAFATTYFTTWDAKALIATDHVNASGGTFSNALTPSADLSEASLEDMGVQIMGARNDRGLNISIMMQSLHVAPSEWYNANRILESVGQSDTNSNNINVLKATNALPKGIKLNHYFTNASSWFVRTNVPQGMQMFWRERPDLQRDNDFHTKNALALAYMRVSFGCTDPLGIFGSNRA